ncbi:MAG: hypothetical protein KY476_15535 [Planctomycetes bacterium]|nr:hypothetical protein [Planctomycetota bacterium]
MSARTFRVNRPLTGVISLVLLGAWVVLWVVRGDPGDATGAAGENDSTVRMWQGACLRVGLLMGALWLALPSKNREAAWANFSLPMLALFVGIVVAVAMRPRIAIPLLIVLGLAALIIRPRAKERPRSRDV